MGTFGAVGIVGTIVNATHTALDALTMPINLTVGIRIATHLDLVVLIFYFIIPVGFIIPIGS